MPYSEEYMTTKEAAAALGLTPSALHSAVNYGALRAQKLDARTNLYARAEVERYRRENLGQRGKRKAKQQPAE